MGREICLPVDLGEAHARGLRRKLLAEHGGVMMTEALDGGVDEPMFDVLPGISAQLALDFGPRRTRQPGAAQLAKNVALNSGQTNGGFARTGARCRRLAHG